ncbi:MAG: sensor histidine kinase [Raoultibacter sp.]
MGGANCEKENKTLGISMSTVSAITMTSSLCASVIAVLILVGMLLGGTRGKTVYRWYNAMLVLCIIGSFCEGALYFFLGRPGSELALVIHILDILSYVCGSLMIISFAGYLREYLPHKTPAINKLLLVTVILCGINIALIVVAQVTQAYALLDEHNRYSLQEASWLSYVAPVLAIVTLGLAIKSNLSYLKKREAISLILYLVLPLACYACEIIFPGLWVSYFGAAVALFLIFTNIQIEIAQKTKEQELELIESRISVMLSQIQPHFLYNTLTSIEYLCEVNEPQKAATAIREFSHYLRGNMDSLSQRSPIPFAKELEHTKLYLSLEKKSGGDLLQTHFDIQASDFSLPALSLQPLAENAVKHGVGRREGGGLISIASSESDTHWYVSVTDDGVGFDSAPEEQAQRSHVGIDSVRRRLSAMCDGSLEIQSVPGKGTTATISIPKGENHL